jgi:hypothetical protein
VVYESWAAKRGGLVADNTQRLIPVVDERRLAPALEAIFAGPGDTYAVVDGARSARVMRLVREWGEKARILYEGPVAPEMAEVAPYLVRAARGSGVAERIVHSAWGDSWGIFCKTRVDGDELRRHLRRFLTVRTEKNKKMLFRFYDPRVLRVYLPTCTPADLQTFFGPIERFVCESEGGASALVRQRVDAGFQAEEVRLVEAPC